MTEQPQYQAPDDGDYLLRKMIAYQHNRPEMPVFEPEDYAGL